MTAVTDSAGASSSEEPELAIKRRLNLDLAEDRRELFLACERVPSLNSLVKEYLDDYLRWFKAPEWHLVYDGGLMSGPEPGGGHSRMGSSIKHLLEITAKLRLLQDYVGFEKLISGLDNPSQVGSTIFEIETAAWCTACHYHIGLVFSPLVSKSTGDKYPDFLWQTTIGDLYCECKQLNQWQRAETQRTSALMTVAAEAMGDPEIWPKDVRMEVLIQGHFRGASENRLKAVVEQQSSEVRRGGHPSAFRDDTFTVEVRDRSANPLGLPDSLSIYQVQVGSVPVPLNNSRSAHLMVTKSIGMARAKALSGFVKDAKTQLPDAGPGGVFIELPSGIDIATQKLQEMLSQPAHQAVVWASIWTGGTLARAVWRNGQPFDARLVEPKRDDTAGLGYNKSPAWKIGNRLLDLACCIYVLVMNA